MPGNTSVAAHGYNAYTRGCRCPICRRGKTDYMRRRRAVAFLETRLVVPGIKHGRCGYEEHGCRCDVCVAARRASH